MRLITKGATDQSVTLFIMDADGLPKTDVDFESAGLDLWYRRQGAAASAITEVTQTVSGAHTDGGFVHIDDGEYRLDLPDAAVASGVDSVLVGGAVTGGVIVGETIQLVAADLQATNLAANVTQWRGTQPSTLNGASNVRAGVESWFGLDLTVFSGAVPTLGILDQGTAQAATASSVTLRSAAVFGDGTLAGNIMGILGSTQGYWQYRRIVSNVESTDVVTTEPFAVTPTGTLSYRIFAGAFVSDVSDRLSVLPTKTCEVQADEGNSPTQILTDLAETEVDHYKDCLVKIVTGDLAQQVKRVTAYDGAGTLTVGGGFTDTPADGVVLEIVND